MKLIKQQKKGFFIAYVITAIMAAASLITYVLNVSAAYYKDMKISVVIMMICALACIAAVILLPLIVKGKMVWIIADALRVAAAVLIIRAGAAFIGMRVESFGYIYGSNLELGNEAAFSAGTQAITGIIFFVITWILSLAASFFEMGKKRV